MAVRTLSSTRIGAAELLDVVAAHGQEERLGGQGETEFAAGVPGSVAAGAGPAAVGTS